VAGAAPVKIPALAAGVHCGLSLPPCRIIAVPLCLAHSSFHRDVRAELFPEDRAGDVSMEGEFGERV
jgi:hypothetical protein